MLLFPGRVVVTSDEAPFVQLETSMGKVIVELYWKHAPQTCQNFASLAAVRATLAHLHKSAHAPICSHMSDRLNFWILND